ncbi:tRNA pseudouridine(55) synthase TruB [Alkalicoccus daliensis]|uniref:tRNA pseudouridine synthase B n=1 Tax=Alkalicoccus daliensis TaxID=745820 RepID=A0A1H0A8F6_9BACI|nr:tRNA pseudouridine(55) synthase TruB [Alkalicoccus daliensis]SDN29504.1 tRNA pseudouridine synthase B [Alkalicoccus daliensis]
MHPIGGILPLWKPKGMTSFDAVSRVRRVYKTKKAGHTGTLDPEVEGVLPICLERATKLVEYLTADKKKYSAEVTIGYSTTTEDAHGEIVQSTPVEKRISEEDIEKTLESLRGVISQTPPMYSAVKIKGKKLYEYAREGLVIDRPSREVTIYNIERTSDIKFQDNKMIFSFDVECSKGTYIRTLSVQIGEMLGYAAHMSDLVRTASGKFSKEDCIPLDILEKMDDPDLALLPVEKAMEGIPTFIIAPEIERKVLQGGIIPLPEAAENITEDFFGLLNEKNELLALYKKDSKRNGMMKPEKMIRTIDL